MAELQFWAQWGLGAVFAGILLAFVLRRVVRAYDKIKQSLDELSKKVDYLYYKHGGHPDD